MASGELPPEKFSGLGQGRVCDEKRNKNNSQEGQDAGGDDNQDVLTRAICYRDHDMEEVCRTWHSELPDYKSSLMKSSAATDSGSLNYVEYLKANSKIGKQRRIFQPSFINGEDGPPLVRTQVTLPLKVVNRSTSLTSDLGSNQAAQAQEPEAICAHESDPDADFVQLTELQHQASSSKSPQPSTSASASVRSREVNKEPKKVKKMSLIDTLTASIELAIANGDQSFVRGGIHPNQRRMHVLNLDRRSGSTNLFTAEDFMPPILPGSSTLLSRPDDFMWGD